MIRLGGDALWSYKTVGSGTGLEVVFGLSFNLTSWYMSSSTLARLVASSLLRAAALNFFLSMGVIGSGTLSSIVTISRPSASKTFAS